VRHAIHPAADAEFTKAVQRYAKTNPDLGISFFREIERLIGAICADPDRFPQIRPPARRALLMRFPYSVIYLKQRDRIWIVAIMHAKRHPNYWARRL
jgi:toxin ParE1/3/4